MPDALDDRLLRRLRALDDVGLTRQPPKVERRQGVAYRVDGHDCVGLCSNDYLGLCDAPELPSDAPASGASASRLVCGDLPEHRELEQRLAALVHADDAVVFPSGFQANVGVLPAILQSDDHVYSDALNHASLIDGIRLARTPTTIVPHLQAPEPSNTSFEIAWWVTESVFSMDGDQAHADDLVAHLSAGHCVYLDEAHAFGLFVGGAGWARHMGVVPTVLVGTLSKALGCAGAYVAGSRTLCSWLRARARSFVFSTGMSPAIARRVLRALDIVQGADGDQRRERLWANARRLADRLEVSDVPSPIFPILIGDNDRTVAIAGALLDMGWHVQPIRPPTVPDGTARLRVTVSSAHTAEQIDGFATALLALLRRHDVPLVVERGRRRPLPRTSGDRATGSA